MKVAPNLDVGLSLWIGANAVGHFLDRLDSMFHLFFGSVATSCEPDLTWEAHDSLDLALSGFAALPAQNVVETRRKSNDLLCNGLQAGCSFRGHG